MTFDAMIRAAGISRTTKSKIVTQTPCWLEEDTLDRMRTVLGLETTDSLVDWEAYGSAGGHNPNNDRPDTIPGPHIPYQPNPRFAYRATELEVIEQLLLSNKIVGITAMGGMGKTQLAIEYAYSHAHQYQDGVWWIDASTSLRSGIQDLACLLDNSVTEASESQRLVRAVHLLRNKPDALLIVDDLPSSRSLYDLLTPDARLPMLPGRVLFTSRDSSGPFPTCSLAPLPLEASVALLLSQCDSSHLTVGEQAAAKEVAALLGGLPLALEIAALHLGHLSSYGGAARGSHVLAFRDDLRTRELVTLDDPGARIDPTHLATIHETSVRSTLHRHLRLLSPTAHLVLKVASSLQVSNRVPLSQLRLLTGLGCPGASTLHGDTLDLAIRELSVLLSERTGDAVTLHSLVCWAMKEAPWPTGESWETCAMRFRRAVTQSLDLLESISASRGTTVGLAEDLDTAGRLLQRALPAEAAVLEHEREELTRILQSERRNLVNWSFADAPFFFAQQLMNRAHDTGHPNIARIAADRLRSLRAFHHHAYLELIWHDRPISDECMGCITAHERDVNAVAVTPGADPLIVSASSDATVRVWRPTPNGSATLLHSLEGHSKAVWSIAAARDGRHVATASDDNSVRIWDVREGAQVASPLLAHDSWVNAVAISKRHVVSGDDSGIIYIWDTKHRNQPRRVSAHLGAWVLAIAIAEDGESFLSGAQDGTLKQWALPSGEQLGAAINAHDGWVRNIQYVSAEVALTSGGDGLVRRWNLKTGTPTLTLRGHGGMVRGLALLRAGNSLASASDDETLRLWNLSDDGESTSIVLTGHRDLVRSVVEFPGDTDTHSLVSGSSDGTIRFWRVPQKQRAAGRQQRPVAAISSFDGHIGVIDPQQNLRVWRFFHNSPEIRKLDLSRPCSVRVIAFAPGGGLFALLDDGAVIEWRGSSSTPREVVRRSKNALSIAWSHRFGTLLTANADGTIEGVSRDLHLVSRIRPRHVSFTAGGEAACLLEPSGTFRLFETEDGKSGAEFRLSRDLRLTSVFAALDRNTIAVASEDRRVYIFHGGDSEHIAMVAINNDVVALAGEMETGTLMVVDSTGSVYRFRLHDASRVLL